jgi:hypothetical protein
VVVAEERKLSRQEAWFILRAFESYPSWDPDSEETRAALAQKTSELQGMLQGLDQKSLWLARDRNPRGMGRRLRRKQRAPEVLRAELELSFSAQPRISRTELLGGYFGLPLDALQKRVNKTLSGDLYARANASTCRTLARLLARGLLERGPSPSTYLLTERGLVVAKLLVASYWTLPARSPGLKGTLCPKS